MLRSWAPRARGWIPWTAVGFGLAHSLNDMFPYRPFDLLVMLLISGVVIGVLQAIALRRALPMPWVWILVAVFAWVAGWTVGAQVINHIDKNPLAELFLGSGSTGLIIGAITGVVFLAHLGPGQAAVRERANTDLVSPTP